MSNEPSSFIFVLFFIFSVVILIAKEFYIFPYYSFSRSKYFHFLFIPDIKIHI